jgi:tRNA-2-methylthio-N6-dimethylallyladenosine synthase
VVPYTRGTEISRPFDDVLAEVAMLAEQGVREITLLGQNVNDYQGQMHTGEIADLALLIHTIAALDNIARIRFTTSHPLAFSDRLIEAYASEPKLANHLHLPVQSGSDRILAAMKRGYTVLEYKSKMRKLKAARPDITISTDLIVGFPGETDADFQATLDLVHEIGFDNSYSFVYSKRPGTPAASLPDNVPMEVKKERLNILQQRIALQTIRISQNMLGSIQQILVTGAAKKGDGMMAGRTENNRVVNFIGPANLMGQLVEVKITEALNYSLRGELIGKVG